MSTKEYFLKAACIVTAAAMRKITKQALISAWFTLAGCSKLMIYRGYIDIRLALEVLFITFPLMAVIKRWIAFQF